MGESSFHLALDSPSQVFLKAFSNDLYRLMYNPEKNAEIREKRNVSQEKV